MNKVKLATAVLIASTVPATVSAQVLEEVMVTAQKRSESLQDVPIAVTAFTGEAWSLADADN